MVCIRRSAMQSHVFRHDIVYYDVAHAEKSVESLTRNDVGPERVSSARSSGDSPRGERTGDLDFDGLN